MLRIDNKMIRGFTLIELLIVIAIIGVISSIVLVNINSARVRAEDSKRVSEINLLINAITSYDIEKDEWPGAGDSSGLQISPDCPSDLINDLISSGYLGEAPKDPKATSICSGSGLRNSNLFFYGWDSTRSGLDYCISVNNMKTDWGLNILISKYGQAKMTNIGSDANIDNADFNYCFGDS